MKKFPKTEKLIGHIILAELEHSPKSDQHQFSLNKLIKWKSSSTRSWSWSCRWYRCIMHVGPWLSLTTYLWLSQTHLIPKQIKLFAALLSWPFWFTTVPHKIHVQCCVLCWRMTTVLMNIGDVLCQPANKPNEEISTKNDKKPRCKLIEPFSPSTQKETNLPRTLGPFIRGKKDLSYLRRVLNKRQTIPYKWHISFEIWRRRVLSKNSPLHLFFNKTRLG